MVSFILNVSHCASATKRNPMTNKHNKPIFYFLMIALFLCISGCDKSVDTTNQELDLSRITATGTHGPGDFIGNIDPSDWAPSSYNAVVFGRSFWMQRNSSSDTLLFGGRSAGDSSSQSLKIFNWGNSVLSSAFNKQPLLCHARLS